MKHDLYNSPFVIVVLGFVILEALYTAYVLKGDYDVKQTAASLGVAIGSTFTRPLTSVVLMMVFPVVARFAPWHLSNTNVWSWVTGFFVFEFSYYWMHRFSHTVRWLWASHAVHHSSSSFTLPSAIRLGWTNLLSGEWLLFLPMILLGFSPLMVVILASANLAYQFFLHTELSPKWGWLEYVLNTPSHHRIHHASNKRYLDTNFGGVLIIYDHMFKTFAADDMMEPVRFGLTNPMATYNPIVISLREWGLMFRDVAKSRSLAEASANLFGRPK